MTHRCSKLKRGNKRRKKKKKRMIKKGKRIMDVRPYHVTDAYERRDMRIKDRKERKKEEDNLVLVFDRQKDLVVRFEMDF
jgi:hypothetical protein